MGAYSPLKYDFKINGPIEDVASHFECYYLLPRNLFLCEVIKVQ